MPPPGGHLLKAHGPQGFGLPKGTHGCRGLPPGAAGRAPAGHPAPAAGGVFPSRAEWLGFPRRALGAGLRDPGPPADSARLEGTALCPPRGARPPPSAL